MSISSFCIEQREREQEALKKFLTFSLAGSCVLHIAIILNGNWLFPEPVIAEEPIELIIVEEAEPEVEEPKEEKLTKTPEPKPSPVKTPPPPTEPVETKLSEKKQAPSPIPEKPSQTATRPAPVPPPPKPIEQSVPPLPAQVPVRRRERPDITPPPQPEPVAEEPTPSPPTEPIAASTSTPPKPENDSQPLPKPREIDDTLKESLRDLNSEPTEDSQPQENSVSPGSVVANNSAPPRPRQTSQPLARISDGARKLRESFTGANSSPSAEDSNSQTSPSSPGSVAANNSAPARPRGVSAPVESSGQSSRGLRESLTNSTSSSSTSPDGGESTGNPTSPGTVTAAHSAPERPQVREGGGGITCVSRCEPEYPSALDGQEGRASVRVVVDANGNVTKTEIVGANSSSLLAQQALAAARNMKFSKPNGGGLVAVKVTINFTVEGSEFERRANERLEQQQAEEERRERERRAELERQREEQERQAELERQREEQERQAELERQREEQERQAELERQREEQERQAELERQREEQERQAELERQREEQERQRQLEQEDSGN
ncbi:MAG: TonB family protein [Coleofasciculaceae cyanobacterium]